MGGCGDNLLSSHLKEDRTYHEKRKELKKLMPALGQRLEQMKTAGEQSSPVYSVLSELRRQVVVGEAGHSRVPLHVLLRGEDLLRREVPELRTKETTNSIIEAVWRCSGFRAAVAKKIRDAFAAVSALQRSGLATEETSPATATATDSAKLEEKLFLRARTKDEYLESAARAIVAIRNQAAAAAMVAKRRERVLASAALAAAAESEEGAAAELGRRRVGRRRRRDDSGSSVDEGAQPANKVVVVAARRPGEEGVVAVDAAAAHRPQPIHSA